MEINEIRWEDGFETGDPVIDSQHREMIQLANLVLCSLRHGCEQCRSDDDRLFRETFEALRRYTSKHFADEEKFMARYDMDGLEQMKRHHQTLRDELNGLWNPGQGSAMPETARALHGWITGRLIRHFTQIDRPAFARYAIIDDD